MKKYFAILPIAILLVLLSGTIKTYAATANSFGYYIRNRGNGEYNYHILAYNFYEFFIYNGNPTNSFYYCQDVYSATVYDYQSAIDACNNFIENHNVGSYNPTDRDGIPENLSSGQSLYVYNIPYSFLPDNAVDITPSPEDPTWYDGLFQDFIDYIGAGLNNGIDGFLNWLREAWITPVGEGEDELALDLITPTPTPTPLPTPTPIPYQTQLVPDGNGGYNITYIYNNPSGVPTSAPQPPTNQPQPTGSVSYDDDFDYPYYDNPNNKNDPYTLDIPWYLKFSFGGAVASLDDFQEGMDAIVDNVNDQDENISVVMDSMGLFPSDWLLMIGFIGAIPLVGGLISRLLKG